MKKILALLMALTMLLSFAACGGEPNVRGEKSNSNTGTTEETQEELSLGAVDGLTYENKFIGIGCTLDSTWTFSSDEEMKALNSAGAELMGEEYVEAMKEATVVYDMMATKDNLTDNIQVNLEKMNALQAIALDVAENYKAVAQAVRESYESMGATGFSEEYSKLTIDGKEFDVLNITVDLGGVQMYQTILSIKCGTYLANVIITTAGENTVSSILEGFYLV